MFDGNISTNTSTRDSRSYPSYLLPSYQTSKITCPVAIFYGGKDTIPETEYLLNEMSSHPKLFVHKEDNYEHLDFIWAMSAPERIFTKVTHLLNQLHS